MAKDARELFTWKDEHKSYGIKLWDALDGDDRAAQTEALLASTRSFVFTIYHPVALSTGLIQFLAVLPRFHFLNRPCYKNQISV